MRYREFQEQQFQAAKDQWFGRLDRSRFDRIHEIAVDVIARESMRWVLSDGEAMAQFGCAVMREVKRRHKLGLIEYAIAGVLIHVIVKLLFDWIDSQRKKGLYKTASDIAGEFNRWADEIEAEHGK